MSPFITLIIWYILSKKKRNTPVPKKGKGAYWGPKADAKKESSRVRREDNEKSVLDEVDGLQEGIKE